MDPIFHEKQEGSLCAQHCLNSLLQGPYFTAVDLSTLAHKLDEEERQRMAESGEETEDYQRFLQQPSGNMDDSGYFSVQVISSALQVWSLELVPYLSADERIQQHSPSDMNAFICNYRDHWFTIRRLGRNKQWFNLNSLLSKPAAISDTYLTLFLAQLKNEGYSIFVVLGQLPECPADDIVTQPSLQHQNSESSDLDLQTALQMSLSENRGEEQEQEDELQRALRLSLMQTGDEIDEQDDEALLRKAIDMSLQC